LITGWASTSQDRDERPLTEKERKMRRNPRKEMELVDESESTRERERGRGGVECVECDVMVVVGKTRLRSVVFVSSRGCRRLGLAAGSGLLFADWGSVLLTAVTVAVAITACGVLPVHRAYSTPNALLAASGLKEGR